MAKTVIFHVDVNSAFLSWEAVYRLQHLGATTDLRKIPSAIGGDMKKRHGIILAKSLPAKKYGICTGESIPEALKKYPDLYLTPPNYNLYERCSAAFLKILEMYTPNVEQYSIDEAYMDMTGTEALWGSPIEAADQVRKHVYEELGFTVNIGISENKILAKMASDFQKPDRTHTLFPEEIPEKMWPLPVRELFFVGRSTERHLSAMGISTIGELANTPVEYLRMRLKSHGETVWNFANGRDFSIVEAQPIPNKGYGNSTTIAFDVTDEKVAKLVLLALCETVASRLRQNHVKAQVVSINIKTNEFQKNSHQCLLLSPTNITNEIHKYCCALFDQLWDGSPIRHLGVHTSRIVDESVPRQILLFDTEDYEKLSKMDRAVDEIRGRYGIDSVKRAVFECNKSDSGIKAIDHMSGGISREKRSVDYSQLDIQ